MFIFLETGKNLVLKFLPFDYIVISQVYLDKVLSQSYVSLQYYITINEKVLHFDAGYANDFN